MAFDRSKFKRKQKEEVEDSYRTKDYGNTRGLFDPSKVKNVEFFMPEAGDHIIDIVPFLVGPNNPKVVSGRAEVGDDSYKLEIYVHYGIGVNNEDQYICLAKTYNKPCPICEYRNELRNEDAEAADALKPKRRMIYNVVDLENESKGIQVWSVSHFFSEFHLATIAKKPRGGGFVPFADPDIGKSISFNIRGKGQNKQYSGFQFVDRDPIPDEILQKSYGLDDLIIVPTYEEVKAALWGSKEHLDAPEEDDDDDIPFKDTKTGPICPSGAEFGADFDQYEDCDQCEVRIECQKASPSYQPEPEPEPEPEPQRQRRQPTPRKKS